jgi:hypothetical protein
LLNVTDFLKDCTASLHKKIVFFTYTAIRASNLVNLKVTAINPFGKNQKINPYHIQLCTGHLMKDYIIVTTSLATVLAHMNI